MAKIFVSDLKEGQRVQEHFLVASKAMKSTKAGKPYLDLVLQDRTGSINSKVWDDSGEYEKIFDRGDFIKIDSYVEKYRDLPQLKILRLRLSKEDEINREDYMPVSDQDTALMLIELKGMIDSIKNKPLKNLLDSFFGDAEFIRLFEQFPAAKSVHHTYLGGLLEHILSVSEIALFLAEHYPEVDRDILLAGAILHDIGKLDEISLEPGFDYTDPGKLLGHTSLGMLRVEEKIKTIENFPEDLRFHIQHLIISHQGLPEWGAVRKPMTLEAILLHYSDDIDAKMNIARKMLKETDDPDKRWTDYNRHIEREIYRGKMEKKEV